MTETDAKNATEMTQLCVICQRAYVAGNSAAGDAAFERLCQRYEPITAQICGKMLRSLGMTGVTDDAVQESFVAIWQEVRQGKFDESRSFQPWANTITRRTTVSMVRKYKCRIVIVDLLQDAALQDVGETPRAAIDTQDDLKLITNQLSDEELRLLMKRYCDGADLSELATEYATTTAAIRARIYRIKKRVQEALGILAVSETGERVEL